MDRLADIEVAEVKIDGVNAIIKQPVKDEYMLDIEVETFGEIYPEPQIKYRIKGE